jgi:adenylate cyclase
MIICLFTIVVGMIYQAITEDGYIGPAAITMGLFLGLSFGILELFLLKKLALRLRKLPFIVLILVKATIYTILVVLVTAIIGFISGLFMGLKMEQFWQSMFGRGQFITVTMTLFCYMIIIFFIQVSRILGNGVLIKFLSGKYHKPVEEERIFMFLDLKSSTTIAEKIGHKKFYGMLNTFFGLITEPVLLTRAEIYQYVGDEIVFTWPTKYGFRDANCLKIFYLIRDVVARNQDDFIKDFGMSPEFKAGIHYGTVVVGLIGDLKREFVFNGDVLNTTARMQELCNQYKQELIVSRNVLTKINFPENLEQEYLGKIQLRGKENEVHLYGICQK